MKQQDDHNDKNLYRIADELRSIASAGLNFSENGYDRERYERVLKLSARLVSVIENSPFKKTYALYRDNLAHISPLLAVEGLVFRDGKILLIQR